MVEPFFFSLHCILLLFFFPGHSLVFLTVNTKYSQFLCQQHHRFQQELCHCFSVCSFLLFLRRLGESHLGCGSHCSGGLNKAKRMECLYIKCLYLWKKSLPWAEISRSPCAHYHTNIDYAGKLLACKPCFSTILFIVKFASCKRFSY